MSVTVRGMLDRSVQIDNDEPYMTDRSWEQVREARDIYLKRADRYYITDRWNLYSTTKKGEMNSSGRGALLFMKPTVSSNHARIIKVEEDLTMLEDKVEVLDKKFIDVMARLDTLLRIGRGIAVMVAAGLGFDLGIEGGMI